MSHHPHPRATVAFVALAMLLVSCGQDAAPLEQQLTLVTLPGDSNQFSNYDLRQEGSGPVDWPVTFVFTGNASVDRIKKGLCEETQSDWKYCDAGGSMFLYANTDDTTGPFTGFDSDKGIKRFSENCGSNDFTAHMRIYAPPAGSDTTPKDSFNSAAYGQFVLATVHLDFQDKSGCNARVHGYSEVAEDWFVEAMQTIPGWEVHPDSIDFGNGNETFVVMRDVSGAEVPHVYENDRRGTEVVIT